MESDKKVLISNDLKANIQSYLQARTSYNQQMPTINLRDSELEAILNPQSEEEKVAQQQQSVSDSVVRLASDKRRLRGMNKEELD